MAQGTQGIGTINPSEHFSFYTPIGEMNNKSIPSSPFHAGFMRTSLGGHG